MTPLIFITIVIVVLTLLIYWVINTIDSKKGKELDLSSFNYETAGELFKYIEADSYKESIKIQLKSGRDNTLYACWEISSDDLEEIAAKYGVTEPLDRLYLRIHEMSEVQRYYDTKVSSLNANYRLELSPGAAYYISLLIKKNNKFINIASSRTIIKRL